MKKSSIISLVAIMTMAASCSSSEDFTKENNNRGNTEVTLNASVPSSVTRTELADPSTGNGLLQTWKSGDAIKVINSTKNNDTQTFTTNTGSKATAAFTGSLNSPSANDQLYAFYPSSVTTSGVTATVDYSAQDGTLEGVAKKAVMYAAANYQSAEVTDLGTFTNAGAILRLKLTFPVDVTIKKIVLMANGLVATNTLALSGSTGSVSATWGASPEKSKTGMTATLTSPQSFTANTAGYIYMAAIPQTGLNGVSIFAMTDGGAEYSAQLSAANVAFIAGKVHTLTAAAMTTDIAFGGTDDKTTVSPPIDIDNDGYLDLMTTGNIKWLTGGNANNNPDMKIKMMKNITQTQGYWAAIGDSSYPFKGIFDGNGKTANDIVCGYTGSKNYFFGFFGCVDGATIKNLNIEGKNINYGIQTDGLSQICLGGLIGCISGTGTTTITGCSTKYTGDISISIYGGLGATYFAGGLIGKIVGGGNAIIYGCKSETDGKISIESTEGNSYVGGLIGNCFNKEFTVMSCMAVGTTILANGKSTSDQYCFAGGLIGFVYVNTSTIKGCISKCNQVKATTTYSQATSPGNYAAGALFGYIVNTFDAEHFANCYWVKSSSTEGIPTLAAGYPMNSLSTVSMVNTVGDLNASTIISSLNSVQSTSGYYFVAGMGDALPTIVKIE